MCKNVTKKVKPEQEPLIDAYTSAEIAAFLTKWFSEAQRPLNFRETNDPYAIMVSEFMLQQTTVAAVQPYFTRFLKQYPAVHALAAASEDDVMSLWAGLGYYRRARQLHAAAKSIVSDHSGTFPDSVAELQRLPGFGRYTAGAVLSQAYDIPAPILEANTVRVFARLAGLQGTIGDTSFMKQLWNVSEALVSHAQSPRDFNRAAMELGALICRPKPNCAKCPLEASCAAYLTGIADQTPVMRPRRESVDIDVVCVVIENNNSQYAVRKIPAGEWHAGLWEFPTANVGDGSTVAKAVNTIGGPFGVSMAGLSKPITILRYQVTHHRVSCSVFHCQTSYENAQPVFENTAVKFLTLKEISKLPLGSAQKKLLRILENEKGNRINYDSRR